LLPIESSAKATPKAFAPPAYSTEPNKTQLIIATDPAVATSTQVIYAETLAHFGEFIRTGNAALATHGSSNVTEIENEVVQQAGTNEKNKHCSQKARLNESL
jgi:predicted GNAT family acetyltransferase